jgi:outer membrane biosynthesis protein TonB
MADGLIQKLRERKGTVLSVAVHVLVLGWGLMSFSARSLEAPAMEDVIPVDISMDDTSKMKAGIESGKKENTKRIADKVGEIKPVDDAVGKVDKKDIVTSTSTPEQQKPQEKPVEKKPDPKPEPKKEEPKQAEKKPDQKANDPIAEALKADAKKPPPKAEAKATPQPTKPKERIFDQSKIASLLDKRDPSRQSITGEAINQQAALGTRTGNANAMVASWRGAFGRKVRDCFTPPYNGQDADQFEVDIDIYMRPDGSVAAEPTIVAVRGPSRSVAMAVAESAKRAVLQCQSYTFLPKEQYETWKKIEMTFGLKEMM